MTTRNDREHFFRQLEHTIQNGVPFIFFPYKKAVVGSRDDIVAELRGDLTLFPTHDDAYMSIKYAFVSIAKAHGIEAQPDNHTVFGFTLFKGHPAEHNRFIDFSDGNIRIGLDWTNCKDTERLGAPCGHNGAHNLDDCGHPICSTCGRLLKW